MKNKINLLSITFATLILVSCASTENKNQEQSTTINKSTCEEQEALANSAYNFGANNVYKSYMVPNDFEGARAQLYLIEQGLEGDPIGSFAVNYKAAEESYNQNLSEAKVMGCDTSKYPISPISAFRKGVEILEKNQNKEG